MYEFIGKVVAALLLLMFYLVLAVIVSIVMAMLISWVWNFTVPDVLSGLVAKGLLPATITWFQAFKLSMLLSLLGISARGGSSSSSSSSKKS